MENEKRRAVDAERLPAEKLEWEDCRGDGRCQQAIDYGTEGLASCPAGKCCQRRAAPAVDAAELDKLKALAEAATPGEWEFREDDEGRSAIAHPAGWVLEQSDEQDALDKRYIAAANPATILRIAALVAQQAARIAEMQELLRDVRSDLGEIIGCTNEKNVSHVANAALESIEEYFDSKEGK